MTAVLRGVYDFMHETTDTISSIEATDSERRRLARDSMEHNRLNTSFCKLFPQLCTEQKHETSPDEFMEIETNTGQTISAHPSTENYVEAMVTENILETSPPIQNTFPGFPNIRTPSPLMETVPPIENTLPDFPNIRTPSPLIETDPPIENTSPNFPNTRTPSPLIETAPPIENTFPDFPNTTTPNQLIELFLLLKTLLLTFQILRHLVHSWKLLLLLKTLFQTFQILGHLVHSSKLFLLLSGISLLTVWTTCRWIAILQIKLLVSL